jgi:hypothetical protein
MQKQRLKTENRTGKMLARNNLRMESPAFNRMPTRQNVRLLFAFCSLNFYIFFVKLERRERRWEGNIVRERVKHPMADRCATIYRFAGFGDHLHSRDSITGSITVAALAHRHGFSFGKGVRFTVRGDFVLVCAAMVR